MVGSAAPSPRRWQRRLSSVRETLAVLPAPVLAVPPRAFGHALVVALCLAVAWAGRTDRLADQPSIWPGGPGAVAPSALAGPTVPGPDALLPVPPAGLPSHQPQPMRVVQYRVQPGDDVAALADRFDVSENTILWANNLAPGQPLVPGQQLTILPVSGVFYTTRAGDTLDAIAQRFQTDREAIAQINRLATPVAIAVGTRLIIPGGRQEDAEGAPPPSLNLARPQDGRADPNPPAEPPAPRAVGSGDAVSRLDLNPRVPFAARFAAPRPLVPLTYTVMPGDTLNSIADHFGVSPASIADASGLSGSEDALAIDQKLLVPPVPGTLHVVREGDTLISISERYGADPDAIVKANALSDPSALTIGQTLVIPNGKVPSAGPAPDAAPAAPASGTYTVQDGDGLSSIADSYGIDVRSLIAANGLTAPFVLQPGQKLVIPGGSTAPSASTSTQRTATAASPAVVAAPVVARPVAAAPAPRPIVAAALQPAPAPAASSSGWAIVGIASKYLGYAYTWGGTSPGTGFDCSGFVYYVLHRAGIPVSRDLWGQLQSGPRVSRGNLQPGDLVFFANTYEAGLSHVGIYIGGGRFIHAIDYGYGVGVSGLSNAYWSAHYYGASRPW